MSVANQNRKDHSGTIHLVGFEGKRVPGWRLLEEDGQRYLVGVTELTWKNLLWPTASARSMHSAIRLNPLSKGFDVWARRVNSREVLLAPIIAAVVRTLSPSGIDHPLDPVANSITWIVAVLLVIPCNMLWSRWRRAKIKGKVIGDVERVRVQACGNVPIKSRVALFLIYVIPIPFLLMAWMGPINLWGHFVVYIVALGCQRLWIEGVFPGQSAHALVRSREPKQPVLVKKNPAERRKRRLRKR